MSSTYGTNIHRIYIFFADKSGNIFYIVILLFFRNNGCNNTGKTTAMNTAYTCTDFFQEKLCQCESSCDFLLPIAIDSSKAEKHILDDEKEARSYFDQLWAEAMEIYWSTENKSSLLKFSKEMEQEISEYRKQFTQEDTMAGMIQGWLDAYKGSHVCSVQIWKEAFDHFDREPKKFETNEICSIMDTQIAGWKRAGVHRFSKEGYGRQRSWIREGAEEEGGNEPDKDGFTKLTKAEQLELPFDLPDREKG